MSSPLTSSPLTLSPPAMQAPDELRFLLRALPREWAVSRAELRTWNPARKESRLLVGEGRGGSPERDAEIDDGELAAALAFSQTSVIADLDPTDEVRSWLVVPLEEPGPAGETRHLLLATAHSKDGITAQQLEDLERLTSSLPSLHAPASVAQGSLADTLANVMPVPVLITDAAGNFFTANDNFVFLFCGGTPPRPGDMLTDVVPPDHAPLFEEILALSRSGGGAVERLMPPLDGVLSRLAFTVNTHLHRDPQHGPLVIFAFREVSAGIELSHLRTSRDQRAGRLEGLLAELQSALTSVTGTMATVREQSGTPDTDPALLAVVESVERTRELVEDVSRLFGRPRAED